MTEKSKLITGLKKGEIIKSPNNYFTEAEKRQIAEEYLNTDSSKFIFNKNYKTNKTTI